MKPLVVTPVHCFARHAMRPVLPLAFSIVIVGCASTIRATQLAVDHHVGMVRGAMDIVTGEADAREQRLAKMRADIEASHATLAAEQDQGRLIELLRRHMVLQDALVTELLRATGHHDGTHQKDKTKSGGTADKEQQESHAHWERHVNYET